MIYLFKTMIFHSYVQFFRRQQVHKQLRETSGTRGSRWTLLLTNPWISHSHCSHGQMKNQL